MVWLSTKNSDNFPKLYYHTKLDYIILQYGWTVNRHITAYMSRTHLCYCQYTASQRKILTLSQCLDMATNCKILSFITFWYISFHKHHTIKAFRLLCLRCLWNIFSDISISFYHLFVNITEMMPISDSYKKGQFCSYV